MLVYVVVNSFIGLSKKKPFLPGDLKMPLVTMSVFHLQFLIGIILYVVSPKVQFSKEMLHITVLRYFTIEHVFLMIISIVLITAGYSVAKRRKGENNHRFIFYIYFIALLIILYAIPWPFKANLGGSWF
jgi:bacteriorhodopsin